jgi:peptidoglycan hydrolase FlgJ
MALRIDPNAVNVVGREKTQAPDANDFKQFATLRRSAEANDPKALREVARQFESLFTKMMMDSMRSASFGDPMFGSDQTDMYQDMMDDQMAVQLSSGKGIGLADMLIRQLSQSGMVSPEAAEAAGSKAPVTDAQRRDFVEKMLPQAEAAARELGVDARSVIAQAALETGWGTAQPADGSGGSHNYFGIKSGAGWHGATVSADTTEFTNGVAGIERAQFRAYGSVAENMSDYVRLLRDNPRYSSALNTGDDVHAFGSALQRGGYATDPAYADKLVAVAAQLDQLNSVNSFKSTADEPISTREPSSQNLSERMRKRSNG